MNSQSIVRNTYFWVGVWIFFVIYYAISLRCNFHIDIADKIAYLIQVIADIFMVIFSTLAYLKTTDKKQKWFYFLILLSIFLGIITNQIYNILANIFKGSNPDFFIHAVWIFYSFFLFTQIVAWFYLLYFKTVDEKNITWVSYFPAIQSAMVIILSFFLLIVFKDILFNKMSFLQKLNTFLEVILFTEISVCLSRTKNKSLIYLEAGFLFLIAFNLAHRFSHVAGHYSKPFDIVWLICYFFIIQGFLLSAQSKNETINFFEKNSIHVLISAIFTIFSTVLFILFLLLGFIISSIEINSMGGFNIFPENIPSILVFSLSLSVLMAKFVAEHFSKPLERISHRIDFVYGSDSAIHDIPLEKFEVVEVDKLDKFILKTINELKIANRVKAQFLMDMSHDFRTPASGIYHMSRSIYKRTDHPNLKKLQKLVVDSSQQLMNLLEDILDYSRLDSGKYELHIEKINICSIIQEIILFISPKAEEKKLFIRLGKLKTNLYYYGDQLMIHRILLNIVSNAIKFTEVGGVKIFCKKELVDNRKWLIIKIKDTGIGIDSSHHQLIFEPFARIASKETAKHSGIGLGLRNVLLMLKKMGGKVIVKSKLGTGATFSVYLPIEMP